MAKEVWAIIIGFGVEIIFGIMGATIETMPVPLAIAGYIIGGLFILFGSVGLIRPRLTWKPIKKRLNIIRRLSTIWRLRLVMKEDIKYQTKTIPLIAPSWLKETLLQDLEYLEDYIKIKVNRWDFSGLGNSEPYFEMFLELVNASVFTVDLIGSGGYMVISGTRCNQTPEISKVAHIGHGSATPVRVRQPIEQKTAERLRAEGESGTRMIFDLTKCYLEIEITTAGYEGYRYKVAYGMGDAVIPK